MKKFALGYQEPLNGEAFANILNDYRDSVAEVYFSWPGTPSGRDHNVKSDPEGEERLAEELERSRELGIRLDMLFNANCYGGNALSSELERSILVQLERMEQFGILPETVTTTSPFLASVIRKHFSGIEIRASVNMRLDSTLAMEYLSEWFDSFYIRRDLQRDLNTVKRFSAWCVQNGKKLCMLVNSGCMRNCPAQTFHDNLVAHAVNTDAFRDRNDFLPHLCWHHYRNRKHFVEFLRSSWIRPEDLHHYDPYVSVFKLATRVHTHPRMVIGAYSEGKFSGNLLSLTEPNFSMVFAPYILDNSAFPADWFSGGTAGACATDCTHCGRCEEVLKMVLKKQLLPFDFSGNP